MLRINASELEDVLFAVEEVVLNRESSEKEVQELLLSSRRQTSALPKAFLQELLRVTKVLLRPLRLRRLGRFVVLTGVDKSGKETQAFNNERKPGIVSLSDYFVNKSFEVYRLALPSYGTTFGSLIASYLGKENSSTNIVGNLSKNTAWILWSLDRAQHNPEIEKWLEGDRKKIVVSKRWTETNIAYQKPQGIDEKRILRFERNLAKADYTIVLDVPLDSVFSRMITSGEVPDRYETRDFLSGVSDVYRNLEKFYRVGKVLHIDGSGSFEEVNRKLVGTAEDILSELPQTISERSC
jgi:thymidylate kinase